MTDSAVKVNSEENEYAQALIKANCDALQEGVSVLNELSSDQFTQDLNPTFQATIGAHFRHLIEHYQCFLVQLEDRLFNYDCRPRQSLLESDLPLAVAALEELVEKLSSLTFGGESLNCRLIDTQSGSDLFSSISRELLFLQAHTVHHYAIIAAMMRSLGALVPPDFGVAISTQQYFASVANQTSIKS